MARPIYGAGLQSISGSINKQVGGWTFSEKVIRRRVVPVNPQTADQSLIRAAFLFLTSAWSLTLTDTERLAWESARTGNAYWLKQDALTGVSRPYASAKDLFIAVNLNSLVATDNLGLLSVVYSTPGVSAGTDTIGITSIVFDDSAQTVTITYTGAFANEDVEVFMTPPVPAGTMRLTSVKSKLRFVTQNVGVSPAAISAAYLAKFGALTGTAGLKVFWELYGVDTNTGKKRLIASGSSIIVA